jgi:hypothetical protein
MAVMAGAHFLDAARPTLMSRWDIVCIHTIVGYAPANAAHFSTRADGYVWQSRDTRYRSAANLNGNHRVIAIENEDHGPAYGAWSGANVPFLTAAQVEANAQICAWAHRVHGVPLVACPNSLPGSRGIAYHRQGIDGNFAGFAYPGRIPGGELWSSAFGKVCAGDRRISQLTQIIHRARQIVGLEGADMDQADKDTLSALAWRVEALTSGAMAVDDKPGVLPASVRGEPVPTNVLLNALAWRVKALLDGAESVPNEPHVLPASVRGEPVGIVRTMNRIESAVAELSARVDQLQVAGVDVAQLAAALAPLVSTAVNDEADARRRDGDPTTGPTS